jgi:type I restriction-modification system DNA methylase subunit
MTAPKEIVDLVGRFEQNRDQYISGNYNEAQLRQEFLNPFFAALGWDVENRQGYAEAYKEVIHEDAIKIGTATKAPDYSFRMGGTRKFFVEAKNPSVNLKEDITPAYQLRRYAWSAKLPLSILTDFEELAIYDCRTKPLKTDKASVGRIRFLTFREYIEQWDTIASAFSKEAVLKGSFDKYAESTRAKKGTAEVDDAFLKEIESWRELLARNIALRNSKLTQRELNFAVQRTIDRIIFLRICEDRGVETYARLLSLVNGERVYRRLYEQFYRADEKYNSGLFHFDREKGRPEQPDELTPKLHIDDRPLKEIIGNLYYPDCPYEFSVLPADILGQVYEQFLGKVIRLTAGHQAKVEDKPEVKKAGGVYYTPTYIVDYIVKNTVGKLLNPDLSPPSQGRPHGAKPMTPKEASKLRILDPACGSGSFLIGACQYLLDWHRDWYVKNDPTNYISGRNAALFKGPGGDWRLTTAERKRILLNNIYGVDIDSQAVEVTKLSLLLKVLEGENEQTISQQLKMFHERALPDLGNNIKCGNSLIGPDFHEGKQLSLLEDEERMRINVFDWNSGFKEIMDAGGFDAVIGNPPYGASLSEEIKLYLAAKYPFVSDFETSQFFLGEAERLARDAGYVSFIVPITLFLNVYAHGFRHFIATHFSVERMVSFAEVDVFEGATVRTSIPLMIKGSPSNGFEVDFVVFQNAATNVHVGRVEQRVLAENDKSWLTGLVDRRTVSINEKIAKITIQLNEIVEVSQGLIPYDKYRGHDEETIRKRIWHADKRKDKTYRRELRGADVTRYAVRWNGRQWISYGPWLAAPRKPQFFKDPRLLFREITDPKTGLLHVAHTTEEFYNNPPIINCISRGNLYSLLYLLGIADSRLIAWLHFNSSPKARKGVFPKILVDDVRKLPIRVIDFSDRTDKSRHDKMVQLVEQMLSLHKQLPAARTEHEKEVLQRQIEATDKQIDQLVYELYGLTDEEIKIVEGKE